MSEVLSPASEEILKAYRGWVVPREEVHPRLFFSEGDVAGLLEKAEKVPWLFNPIVERCEKVLKTPPLEFSDRSDYWGRSMAFRRLEELSFIYALTGEERYAERAKRILFQILGWERWIRTPTYPSISCVLAYDWLFKSLDGEERREVCRVLIDRALKPFERILSERSEWWTRDSRTNWRSVTHGQIGITALGIAERYENVKSLVEGCLRGVLAVLDAGGVDGGWDEGVGYWGYGIGEAVRFAEALKRASNSKVNVFNHPYLKVTGDFGLYLETPDGGCFNFADCGYRPPNPWLMAKLAAEQRNPYWQWCAERNLKADIHSFLWYDPELKGEKPRGLAPSKHFRGIDVAVLRGGWDEKDVFLGFKSGLTTAHHGHLDINSFMLSAFGRRLVQDLGVWSYADHVFWDRSGPRWDFEANATVGHNTLLVDGEGQRYGSEHFGRIVRFVSTNLYDLIVGDGSRVYGELLERFLRYVIYLKPHLILILDDLESRARRRFEWLLHYVGAIEAKQGWFLITNDVASLDLQVLRPKENEGLTVVKAERLSTYIDQHGLKRSYMNKYLSFSPLHRFSTCRFMVLMYVHPADPNYVKAWRVEAVEEAADEAKIEITAEGWRYHVSVNLAERSVEVKRETEQEG
ncbi:hypothetical protein CW680_02585 [Candidatus Bathyarchaeota archaeon]|nr:MAG: hypothetical protein CW680_02585 [Candidatus Bathyarchaeota archaeon]